MQAALTANPASAAPKFAYWIISFAESRSVGWWYRTPPLLPRKKIPSCEDTGRKDKVKLACYVVLLFDYDELFYTRRRVLPFSAQAN
jgi:hypothetical protein